MDITDALQSLRPGASWSISDEDYNTLCWSPNNDSLPPTREEVEAEVARLQTEYKAKEYQRQRAPEYPDIREQLDAIWKGGDAYEEMLAKVMEVKAKYPKPE